MKTRQRVLVSPVAKKKIKDSVHGCWILAGLKHKRDSGELFTSIKTRHTRYGDLTYIEVGCYRVYVDVTSEGLMIHDITDSQLQRNGEI